MSNNAQSNHNLNKQDTTSKLIKCLIKKKKQFILKLHLLTKYYLQAITYDTFVNVRLIWIFFFHCQACRWSFSTKLRCSHGNTIISLHRLFLQHNISERFSHDNKLQCSHHPFLWLISNNVTYLYNYALSYQFLENLLCK